MYGHVGRHPKETVKSFKELPIFVNVFVMPLFCVVFGCSNRYNGEQEVVLQTD